MTAVWTAIRAAAAGRRDGPAGTVRELSTVDGVPRLGWVTPPPWPVVARALQPYAGLLRADRLAFTGTGGWAFGARAARWAGGSSRAGRLRVLDTLAPAVLADLGRGAAVAVSESGRTLETRLLADALADRGAEPRWLIGADLWLDPGTPSVALFGAPLSVPFLLAATAVAGSADTGAAYRRFAGLADRIGGWAERAAHRAAGHRIRFAVPDGADAGLRHFALQALRQGLGGKGAGLWLEVRPATRMPVAVGRARANRAPAPATDRLVRVMAVCYAVCAFVACVAVRRGIRFAEHPAVDRYKRLIGADAPRPTPVAPGEVVPVAAAWLTATGLRRGHLVAYDPHAATNPAGAAARLAARSGRSWEVHAGSAWNHHSYQGVHAEPHLGVVAVAPAPADRLTRAQAAIAAATCASLGPRALLLQTTREAP